MEFFVSKKIIVKNISNKEISKNNRYFRFSSDKLIKLFSMNVKNVIKPSNKVIKKITIKWNGDKETANKYFIFNKWAINNQHLTAFKCMYVPDENEYISGIRQNGTPEEKKELRRQIMFGGNYFGWFGKMVYEFVLGNTLEVKKTLLKNRPEQIVCVKWNRIYIDEEEARIFERLPKKN